MGIVCTGMPMRFGKPAIISIGMSSSIHTILSDSLLGPCSFSSARKLVPMMTVACLTIILKWRCAILSCGPLSPCKCLSTNAGTVR